LAADCANLPALPQGVDGKLLPHREPT